jgi:hypothetical protein
VSRMPKPIPIKAAAVTLRKFICAPVYSCRLSYTQDISAPFRMACEVS